MTEPTIRFTGNPGWNQSWVNHGQFLKNLARDYLSEGKKYTKETPINRDTRSRYAKLAIQYWRDGNWYIWRHQDV